MKNILLVITFFYLGSSFTFAQEQLNEGAILHANSVGKLEMQAVKSRLMQSEKVVKNIQKLLNVCQSVNLDCTDHAFYSLGKIAIAYLALVFIHLDYPVYDEVFNRNTGIFLTGASVVALFTYMVKYTAMEEIATIRMSRVVAAFDVAAQTDYLHDYDWADFDQVSTALAQEQELLEELCALRYTCWQTLQLPTTKFPVRKGEGHSLCTP